MTAFLTALLALALSPLGLFLLIVGTGSVLVVAHLERHHP